MPTTAHELRSRLRPGELPRIAATVTRGASPEARALAAGALALLAGTPRRKSSSSGRSGHPVPVRSTPTVALAADTERAWDAWTARTFGDALGPA